MRLVILSVCLLFGTVVRGQDTQWEGFEQGNTVSQFDGYVNRFYYYATDSSAPQPLVVSIHQWSATYENFKNSMAPQVREKNWNYIQADLRGRNNHPKACGSPYLISDIDETIEWAVSNMNVDTTRIYIVGASGGGFNGLCHFMDSQAKVREYSIWVPITNLDRWYYECRSRKLRYADDIVKCVREGGPGYNEAAARERSPMYKTLDQERLRNVRLNIFAGIHDGYTGSVPIVHSIEFYNKIVGESGGPAEAMVSGKDALWMLTARSFPVDTGIHIGERKVHYYKEWGNISLTIFEGGHEILADEVLTLFEK